MNARVQVIRNKKGAPAYAVVPWDEYRRLAEAAGEHSEDAALIALADKAREGEFFPIEVADRLRARENVVKVLREWRDLTQRELAAKAQLAVAHLSQLETGRRKPGRQTLLKLAAALSVSMGALADYLGD